MFGRRVKITPVRDPARAVYDFRKCEIFQGVPQENARELVSHMQRVEGPAGAVIVRQGDEGDYYYLMLQGRAAVLQSAGRGQKPQEVSELSDGASFGEEALISGTRRNATVRLKTRGMVMRVPKEAFLDYIGKALVDWLPMAEAQAQVEQKRARWVDVRDPGQRALEPLPGALLLPLTELRGRLDELDRDTAYICYCDNGRLSATAAFLMRQHRLRVSAIRGGLMGMAESTAVGQPRAMSKERVAPPPPAPPEAERPAPGPRPVDLKLGPAVPETPPAAPEAERPVPLAERIGLRRPAPPEAPPPPPPAWEPEPEPQPPSASPPLKLRIKSDPGVTSPVPEPRPQDER